MEIPDEVIENIRHCGEGYPAFDEDELRSVVAGVARAAQVQVLRERADWIESCNHDGNLMVERFQRNIARLMRTKADRLEAP
jgi:hypothetical protein